MKKSPFLAAAVTCITVLTACGHDVQQPDGGTAWAPPAWFAEQAQEREEARIALQACMDAKGWNIELDEWGGSDEPFTSQEEVNRFSEESMACQSELGFIGEVPTEASLRDRYAKDLDTWECLRAQGFEVADPPSVETYIESRLDRDYEGEVWLPYQDESISQALETGGITWEEFIQLEIDCPQQWGG